MGDPNGGTVATQRALDPYVKRVTPLAPGLKYAVGSIAKRTRYYQIGTVPAEPRVIIMNVTYGLDGAKVGVIAPYEHRAPFLRKVAVTTFLLAGLATAALLGLSQRTRRTTCSRSTTSPYPPVGA